MDSPRNEAELNTIEIRMEELLITGGRVVNEGRVTENGGILVRSGRIAETGRPAPYYDNFKGRVIRLSDSDLILPGVIDDHVHFREPGLDYKGDIHSESRAAVAGGVTSFMEMPNTKPAATTLAEVERKFEMAAVSSAANYSFYLGATNDNLEEIKRCDPRLICGVKVFMGSSTGNMLVDDDYALSAIFAESPVLVAAHCEDERIIRENMEAFRTKYGEGIDAWQHPEIRSEEACYVSTARAVGLADRYSSHLHVLHLTTARELALFDSKPSGKKITAEACIAHLWFAEADYHTKGNLIKVNPAIKSESDRNALRAALTNGKIDIVATDHAPHTLDEKRRNYWECPSGAPVIEHSLVAMLELAGQGVLKVTDVVEKMCHAPAVRYGVKDRGFIHEGMFADLAIVDTRAHWTVERSNLLCKCKWSPMEGQEFANKVVTTIINGRVVYDRGHFDEDFRGMPLEFAR